MTSVQEVDFLETYALSVDRSQVIEDVYDDDTLDYWYYNLLNVQNKVANATDKKELKAARKELKEWMDKAAGTDYYDNEKLELLFFREALMSYNKVNQEDVCLQLEQICDNVKLDHEQDSAVAEVEGPNHPTTLQLSSNALLKEAYSMVDNGEATISDLFTSRACNFLANQGLDGDARDDFLTLVENEYPDIDNLVDIIQADLESGTIFGERKIHERLTRRHMQKLAQRMPGDKKNPGILGDESFLITYCRKLRPITDCQLEVNSELLNEYMNDLRELALTQIKDNHASLKASILFNYLKYNESKGHTPERKVLMEYMKIPKKNNVYRPSQSHRLDNPQVSTDFLWETEFLPELAPIVDDEPLIRRSLLHFFLTGDKTEPWKGVADVLTYSLPLFAEAQLLAGRGNQVFQDAQIRQYEKSYSPPGAYKRLVQRVELEFCTTNTTHFEVDEPVSLEFWCKNNSVVEVAVYDVNAKNYYKENLNEIPLDLSLSGSITIAEFSVQIDTPSIRRTTESIDLKSLAGRRGVFIVDLVGNGVTTRALIRKGELRYIADQEKQNATGYVFRVFNEQNRMVQKPKIWMSGKDYLGDEQGRVFIPFADEATNENELIILEDTAEKGSATLQRFMRAKPMYSLECGMYIDREQLLKKQQAKVLVRANLYMNDEIITLSNLSEVQFKLTMTNNVGAVKTRIEEFQLFDEKESVFDFTVPTELRTVECVLSCKNPSGNTMISKQLISVNSSDDTMASASMYMFPAGNAGYVLAVRGKNGEGNANIPVKLFFTHRCLREKIEEVVQTDANGHIYLGRLPDIDVVEAMCDADHVYGEASFETLTDHVVIPTDIHRARGTAVKLPFTPEDPSKKPNLFLYDNDYIRSFTEMVKFDGGYIVIEGLPAGDFQLHIRDSSSLVINISISEGAEVANEQGDYVIGKSRVLQLSEDEPLQIVSADGGRDGVTVKLAGVNEMTRVHVVSCAQNPVFNMYGFLASPFCPPTCINYSTPPSKYLPSHPLDSEYMYIVRRKHATKYVGNMLARPSLLANGFTRQPATQRTTGPRTYSKPALDDENLANTDHQGRVDIGSVEKRREGDPASLEFLGDSSFLFANRVVDENNCVHIPGDMLSENHNLVQILAVDDDNTCLRNVFLSQPDENADVGTTDVRLQNPLDVEKHFTEVRRIICLPNTDDSYVINDFSTAEYEPYETLEEPFNLYRSLSASLSEGLKSDFMSFEPLMRWDQLSLREKLNFYDKQSCNETNYFIKDHDAKFFEDVVVPALNDKIQKTFFDKCLLGMDVSDFKATSKFAQLNAFEQVLLAVSLNEEKWTAATLRKFRERAKTEAVDPREQDQTFDLAIKSAQLGVQELEKKMQILEAEVAEAQFRATQKQQSKTDDDDEGQGYLDLTLEYQDVGYYRLPVTGQKSTLIPFNRFWADFAEFKLNPEKQTAAFLSKWFMTVNSNLNELLCALSVLGVPLTADDPKRINEGGNTVKILSKEPAILFVRELIETEVRTSALSVSTNYFDPTERIHVVDGEEVDKFIATDFKTQKVYGCRLVVTNVSSVQQRVEILCQIPEGSIPCGQGCFQTKTFTQVVDAFGTYRLEYFFYWPEAGSFAVFPVHVNKNGETIGFAKNEESTISVEAGLVKPDTESWRYISNLAEDEVVLEFLASSSDVHSVDLSKLCWRFRDNVKFFDSVVQILKSRLIYNNEIWAYALICDEGRATPALGEFLSKNDAFREYIHPGIQSKVVNTDMDSQRDYQVTEFWPLMNPRAHEVDFNSTEYSDYYLSFLEKVAFSSTSRDDISMRDKFCLVNYLLLRNLVEKAKTLFDTIDAKSARKSLPMIYDYMSIYISFHTNEPDKLIKLATQYTELPLPKSVKMKWEQVIEQINHRADPSLSDEMFLKREAEAKRGAALPHLDFFPKENASITIKHRNVESLTIDFYRTELELMFSMYPFQDENVSYKLMRPNMSHVIPLDHNGETEIELPAKLRGENTIVEMRTQTAEGEIVVTKVAYDNHIDVSTSTELGQLRVLHKETRQPLEKAYCKVYAQNIRDGKHVFFKDGYTDICGRFDYRSLSTDQLRASKRLSILISTKHHGSVIKEVDVPNSMQTTVNLLAGL